MTVEERAKPFISDLESRKLTIRALAKLLDCSESYLSRVLSGKLKKVESTTEYRRKRKELRECRQKMREKHALLAKKGHKSLARAAADARCSQRTMRRYMAEV